MKKLLFFVLIIFLCTGCGGSKKLADYPKFNDEVNNLVYELKSSTYFNEIYYDSIDVVNLEGEKAYDVFYKTNCFTITMSYDEEFNLV